MKVAIVGSGIVGSLMAYVLTSKGHHVTVLEKGADYPYPYRTQFESEEKYGWHDPIYDPPAAVARIVQSGDYKHRINEERYLLVGGSAARWTAMTDRMHPHDFRTRSLYGTGADWPIRYEDLEPYYVQAETMLGVSGSDDGDPYAPPRSAPYPLPAFDMTYDAALLQQRLRAHGIVVRSSPQARTSRGFDGRPACQNIGACTLCPIGVRYSPRHHLDQAIASGRCVLLPQAAVRRLVKDKSGRITSLIYRRGLGKKDLELAADTFVVAAGAIESPRLLLLSDLGNRGGHVGQHLMFHHFYSGHADFAEDMFAGRSGPEMLQSRQFIDGPERQEHGGILLQIPSRFGENMHPNLSKRFDSGLAMVEAMRILTRCEAIAMHCESPPSDKKAITLSDEVDPFGDAVPHLHYEASAYDHQTYAAASKLAERLGHAMQATAAGLVPEDIYQSACHHLGTCRMGLGEDDSVVDASCRVHGTTNLYLVGGANFAGSTAVHPTLTMAALALRAAAHLA